MDRLSASFADLDPGSLTKDCPSNANFEKVRLYARKPAFVHCNVRDIATFDTCKTLFPLCVGKGPYDDNKGAYYFGGV